MSRPLRVELLCLGDELLLGIRTNTHLGFLGQSLSAHGLPVSRSHELLDQPALIREVFSEAWARTDLLITTGGLGPTTDDLTRETIAEVLGRKLVHSPEQEALLRDFFQSRGYSLPTSNLRQCYLIEGAQALHNPRGTAPGQWLEADGKILIMLPGPPNELTLMWEKEALPRLVAREWARPRDRFLQIRTSGIGESALAEKIEPILAPHADKLLVAYCAHPGHVDLRLSPIGNALRQETLQAIGDQIREVLGDDFSHFGECDLAEVIIHELRERERTLAVAESCTGGLLASRFTDICGASRVFMGGAVCYRNTVKENLLEIPSALLSQHGAVSPEVSVAMATAAADLFEADYALSITGYAGPCGGREPPGTVYIGLSSPLGVWSKKVVAHGDRETVKLRAVNAALDLLRRKMRKCQVYDFLDRLCI